ncbi:ATP-binding protein [Uliginosibacterium sp. H3]|uniref:histidine kinase n=1 Tax=Uliginosibacterium silvisoli TaxID=3114758 RepID=A0ABU6K6A2_9RHOO|nr:ATP-binding protein [Uliginosibacterium sp. H3]
MLLGLQESPVFSLQLLLAVPEVTAGQKFETALRAAVEQVGDELLCLWLYVCAARGDARQGAYATLGIHARRTATLASRLAAESGLCDPAHARLAGLWHNLGQLGLCWRVGYPGPVSDGREKQLAAGEMRQYGSDHARLLAAQIEGFLDIPWLAEAIELHHDDVNFVLAMPGLVRVLRAAVVLLSEEPERVADAVRLTGLAEPWVVQLASECMAIEAGASQAGTTPVLHAPMLASLLQEAFRGLPTQVRTLRLRAGCALLGQRELLLSLAGMDEQLRVDPAIDLVPDIELPTFDADSRCMQAVTSLAARPQSAADWLLARQLAVDEFECLPWQFDRHQGACLFAALAARSPLAVDAADGRLIGLMVDAAHAAAAGLEQQQGVITKAVEQGIAKERMHAKRIAHEASNPLTVISNYLAIIDKDASLAQPVRDMQRQMRAEIGRIQRLLGKLGQPVEEEAGASSCMPNEVLREVEGLFYETLLIQQDIRLGLQLAEAAPRIAVPPDALKQILVNLVLNAAEAIVHHGTIDLRSTLDINLDDRAWVEVCVEDSGPGLPRKGMALVLPQASSKGGEHGGVGLSVTRSLIAEAGGRLICRSRSGVGTSFSILLPVPGSAS